MAQFTPQFSQDSLGDSLRGDPGEAWQFHVLEQMATGESLSTILDNIVRMLETLRSGLLCSILVLDESGTHLRLAAGASLPAAYNDAIDGITIGPTAGSCGTAAYLGMPVLVVDIATDPLWADYKDLALQHGLRACWSTPVLSLGRHRKVVGTVAAYSPVPGLPDPEFLKWMGRAEHLICLALETERTAHELRQSEAKFRLYVDNASDAMFLQNDRAEVVHANRTACESLQYRPEQLIGMSPHDFDPDVSAEQMDQLLAQLRAGGDVSFESRHRRRDGTTFPVEIKLRSFYLDEQRFTLGVARDISERKRHEETTERQRHLLMEAQGLAGLGCFEWDIMQNTVTWSAELYSIYGLQPGQFGATVDSFLAQVHPEDRSAVESVLQAALREGGGFRMEERIVRPDGDIRVLESRGRVFTDDQGRPLRMVGVCQDLTARRQMEIQLRESQKMEAVGRLAGGVAHDFNNLLTVINGYADLILSSVSVEDPNWEAVTAIRDAGERAATLTAQLLAFGRRSIVEPKVLDLNGLLEQSMSLIRRLIGEDIVITTKLVEGPALIKFDISQFEQLVINLIINAREAMPSGGNLTISTGRSGEEFELSVSDTGQGMTEEIRANVFEPFFTTKEMGRRTGLGLGLAVVHGVVIGAGGRIEIDSEVGKGTTFHVFLPAAQGSRTARPVAPTAVPGRKTILLVEDEEAVRRIARISLEKKGFEVIQAGLASQALELARQHQGPIDLLVTDVVMPIMGGGQLAEAFRKSRPGVPVLFMSGYTDDAIVLQGINATPDSFLQKPFTPTTLVEKVTALLNQN